MECTLFPVSTSRPAKWEQRREENGKERKKKGAHVRERLRLQNTLVDTYCFQKLCLLGKRDWAIIVRACASNSLMYASNASKLFTVIQQEQISASYIPHIAQRKAISVAGISCGKVVVLGSVYSYNNTLKHAALLAG